MRNNLVSVIITTYNTKGKLTRAINSVLDQTYKNVEVIIVDDNNPNSEGRSNTENIINKFSDFKNVIYIKHDKNKNGAAARNSGISKAKGKYICFLDDDDFYLPNRIELSVKYLEKNPKYSGVLVGVGFLKGTNFFNVMNNFETGNLQKQLFLNNSLLGTGSNIFIKRECLNKLKVFDEDFYRFQDVEFMIRFFDFFEVGAIDKVLIVKDSKKHSNVPNYEKMRKMVELFLTKFEKSISAYGDSDKEKIYFTYDSLLFGTVLNTKNRHLIKEYEKKIIKYRKLSIKEKIKKNFFFINFSGKTIRWDKIKKYREFFLDNDYKYLIDLKKINKND